MGLRDDFRDFLARKLQAREPSTFVQGGGNINQPSFAQGQPDQDDLERYEAMYKRGGAVGHLLDVRALMTFGVGTEWATDDDDVVLTMTTPAGEAEEITVADWLEQQWPTRARDETVIQLGTNAYWAGYAPAELRRNRDGTFRRVDVVNPVTLSPLYDDHGEVQQWVHDASDGSLFRDELKAKLDTDDIVFVTLYRLGRHPLGISLVGRGEDEIDRFIRNQANIAHALERFAYTGYQWKVGDPEGPTIDDQELRRVRSRAKRLEGARNLVTGADIDISALDDVRISEGINRIAENDIRNLATALGVPLEWTNYGGDGLGTGQPAESRQTAFERQARAEQRRMASQLIEQVARPLIEESPFPDDIHIDLRWGDVVSDQQAVADYLRNFKASYTHNEVREKFGDPPVPDDAPIDGESAAGEAGEAAGGGGGFGDLLASDGDGTGNWSLAAGEPWEQALLRGFEYVVQSDDTERTLFSFDDEDLPQFAKDRIRDAIRDGALFSQFDSVPGGAIETVKEVMLDSLEEQHGWSLDSITDNLMDATGIDREDAERIARTETAGIMNRAREIGYEEQGQGDGRFYWQGPGPNDSRITDACAWLVEQTNPQHGGTPVSLERLQELVAEAPSHDPDMANDLARPSDYVVHPNERHTFVRHVG